MNSKRRSMANGSVLHLIGGAETKTLSNSSDSPPRPEWTAAPSGSPVTSSGSAASPRRAAH